MTSESSAFMGRWPRALLSVHGIASIVVAAGNRPPLASVVPLDEAPFGRPSGLAVDVPNPVDLVGREAHAGQDRQDELRLPVDVAVDVVGESRSQPLLQAAVRLGRRG